MKKDTVLKAILVVTGLAVSLFLAFGSASILDNLGIRTPGIIAWQDLAPDGAIGVGMTIQLLVDWVLWFAVLFLVYFVVTRIFRSLSKRHQE